MTRYVFNSPFTVGLEEELHLVDASTLQLDPAAARVLAGMGVKPEAAGHEAYAAQIELRSPVSATVETAVAALAGHRARALGAGATLLGTGLHPTARHGDAELVDVDRYVRVVSVVRGLLRRTPEAALHIHVGLPDERSAVRAYNAMRRHLPILHGLAANSPWWFGVDSGLASARYAVGRAYPGRGIPPAIADMEELLAQTEERIRAAGLDEATLLWSDMRLHPRLGTLEVRELDVQSRLEDSAALAALARAIVVDAAHSPDGPRPPSDVLQWSMFHASRDGVAATVLADGSRRPLVEVARALVARLQPVARDLGDDAALAGVERIVVEGGAAEQRRADAARGGGEEMLAAAIRETHMSAEKGQ